MKKIALFTTVLALAACGGTTKKIDNDQVYFAFDSAVISDESRGELINQSNYLKHNADKKIVMEGHCDERGSTEYNLALGALRAGNAAHVLIKDGVKSERIKTISYGKEKPQYPGTGEAVWAKNRNVTTKIAE